MVVSGTASSPQGRSEPAPDPRNPIATQSRQRGGWSRPADASPDGEPWAQRAKTATRVGALSATTGVGRPRGLRQDRQRAWSRENQAWHAHAHVHAARTHTSTRARTHAGTRARRHPRTHAPTRACAPPKGKLAGSPMISVVCYIYTELSALKLCSPARTYGTV